MPDNATDQTSPSGGKVLLCEDLADCRLILTLEQDGMVCTARVEALSDAAPVPPPPSSPLRPHLTPPELIWHLTTVNILHYIDYEGVYDFCGDIELGLGFGPTVVARGKIPVKGADGWFELFVKTGEGGIALVADDKGVVDHKKLNLFSEIEVGQKLGMLHLPASGTPGITVQGLAVDAPPGEPYVLKVQEGVILKYDGRVAFAEKTGKVIYEKDAIAVVDYWLITGDLDLKIGNINFNGFVEIKGDVPDDFRVVAEKGLKVHGHVGASLIESDGSIDMASMAGKGIGTIICRGDLKVKFLNQVNVISYGNVLVAKEVRNCLVKSTGALLTKGGVILGGKCVTLEGVEAKVIGSESGVATTVVAGVYFPDSDRFDYLLNRQQDVTEHLAKVSDAINKTRRSIARNVVYAKLAEKRQDILKEQFDSLVAEKERLSAEISASRHQEFVSRNAKINVLDKVMEGASLVLGSSHEKIKVPRNGPVSIIENTRDGGLRFLSLTPLNIGATSIEEQLLEIIDSSS